MKKTSLAAVLIFSCLLSGCATIPKPQPKSVGQHIGEGIDTAIVWTSGKIRTLHDKVTDK